LRVRPLLRIFARTSIRRVFYVLIGTTGALIRLGRHCPPPERVQRILVCRLDLMGDLLFTRPLLLGIRAAYPHATITLLTLPYTAPLGHLYGEVDEIVTVDTNRIRTPRGLLSPSTWREYLQVARTLRRRQFDLGVSVCGRMASLCVFLAGPKRTVGYAHEAYPFLLDDLAPGGRYRQRKHEVEYVRTLAHFAGADAAPERLQLDPPAAEAAAIERRLHSLGVAPEDRLLVVHAGAVNGSAKRWPPIYWARFAERLIREAGAKVVLAGAASDEPLAREVQEHATEPVLSLVGMTTVVELLALLDRADLVASGDSGPLHLAIALGRPLVAAYGPTDPRVHGPYHPDSPVRIHRADIPCSPCYSMAASAECPLGDPICMRLVTVDQMVESALELLRGTNARSPAQG
jgi:lipopolysaccharide heptosyltransferase II